VKFPQQALKEKPRLIAGDDLESENSLAAVKPVSSSVN
jgi:hypothetical protein